MENTRNNPTILIAEDDKDDRILLKEAFAENGLNTPLFFVRDGEEVMDFLYRRGVYVINNEIPDLILLDLNLPKKDGREVLKELKADPVLKRIPVIVFSTSNSTHDISNCYELGASCYMTKPQTFKDLVSAIEKIAIFWFNLVEFSPKALQ